MEYEFYLVNAFGCSPANGNGAGVCLLKSQQGAPDLSDVELQDLAAAINLSETSYIKSYTEKADFKTESRFGLRWFTPTVEVPLCGHATLASAAAIFYNVGNINKTITFDTLSGPLVVEKGMKDSQIRMELPWHETVAASALIGNLPLKEVRMCPAGGKILVRLDDSVTKEQFEKFNPVGSELTKAYKDDKMIGVIATLKGSTTNGCVKKNGVVYDFVSRFFAPWVGVDEDPVCGSAHAVLATYWSDALAKKQLFAHQCSKRTGDIWLDCSRAGTSVAITGHSFTYLKGHVRFQ